MRETACVTLTVRAAEKRDAGRGIARLPEAARKRLGLLSGDTVRIDGDRSAVAKVWPAGPEAAGDAVLIDADTRANAGVKVGDDVAVTPIDVADADRVVIEAPSALATADVSRDVVERALARDLRDRPVTRGEAVHVERLGGLRFVVGQSDPSGTVRVTDDTTVTLAEGALRDAAGEPSGTAGESGTATGEPSGTAGKSDDAVGPSVGASTDEATAGNPIGSGDDEPAPPAEHTAGATYEDIGGLDEELELVRETIELPLSEPEVFTRLGIDPPKGVLLHGPPGTGKTLIARAVANEVDAEFFTIDGPAIMSKYKGESEERLREVFERAEAAAPAIVFFDEIDSIAAERDDGGDVENRVVGQLLSLMDGLDARGDVLVIGATNRVDTLDPALRRGGRFDREVEIGVPGEAGRRQILDVHTRRMPLGDDVDLDRLAARTHGFVGADIESLAQEAAMTALRRARTDDESPTSVTVQSRDVEAARAAVEPSAMREYVAEQPTTDFTDVGGLEAAKSKLERAVNWPLTYGPLFEAANADPPTGILLYGPPGTGKTLLARAIAGESGVNFIEVAGPELLDRYVGESEKAVRDLFDRARQAAPVIVFFDEIDAIATARDGVGGGDAGVGERVVSQLLTELDRASDDPNLAVLAATNRRDALDPALLRPGRLETHIEVPAPDAETRRAVFAVHTAETPLADDVDLDHLANETDGYSGAEIAAVCREAAMRAIERVATEYGSAAVDHADEVRVRAVEFDEALETVSPADP